MATLADIFEIQEHQGATAMALNDALESLARLHTVPRRLSVPIVLDRRVRGQGFYEFSATVPNRPLRITINPRATHPRLTLAHEIGHYLDNQVLHGLKQEFASNYEESFSPLRSAWEQTRMVKMLRHLLSRYATRMTPNDRRYLRHLLTPNELWAATYAQWAAMKADNPSLKKELIREIAPTGSLAGIHFSSQWECDEFNLIMALVEGF